MNKLSTTTKQIRRMKKLIIIEGNISAGKSYLCTQLAKQLKMKTVLEPALDNPYLERFYSDQKKWALTMQIYLLKLRFGAYVESLKLLSRMNNMQEDEQSQYEGIILDRSIFSDVVFANQNFSDGNISQEGMDYYWTLRRHMLQGLPQPDLCIYLDVDPNVCLDRINRVRQRECESGIPLSYLKGLDKQYQQLLVDMEQSGTRVIRMDWNRFGEVKQVESIVTELPQSDNVTASTYKDNLEFLFNDQKVAERYNVENTPSELRFDPL